MAAAEAALKAVEETEKTKKKKPDEAKRKKVVSGASGDYGQDDESDDGAGAAPTKTAEERAREQLDVIMGRTSAASRPAQMPSVLTAQRSAELALAAAAGDARSPETPGSESDETEQEQARRVAWIKHYIKLGDYDRAIELGWDGAPPSAASLAPPSAAS